MIEHKFTMAYGHSCVLNSQWDAKSYFNAVHKTKVDIVLYAYCRGYGLVTKPRVTFRREFGLRIATVTAYGVPLK